MIDLKAARSDPDAYRAALARKGAGEAFDALLEADERWRALVPKIDELRGKTKLKGKPSPEQLAELQQVKEQLRAAEEELRRSRDGARRAARAGAEPAARVRPGRQRGGGRGRDLALGRAARSSRRRASTPRSAASTWSAPRASRARASAT